MKKAILTIVFIILIFVAIIFYWLKCENSKICFSEDNCYSVEIAKNATERERGLSGREKLAQGKGMFFIFEKEEIYSFWMKNMNFPLDIIWLDKNYKIVFIAKNVQICDSECEKIIPDSEAQYVLEINGGEADRIGLKEGNVMSVKK